jgi:hypothetical protein
VIAEFIEPHDDRWARFLTSTPHDVYHLPEYVTLAAMQEGATPLGFYAENSDGALLIPLLKRRLPAALQAPDQWFDLTSPYGYGSPLLASSSVNSLPDLLAAFRDVAMAEYVVSAFVRLHPLMPLPNEALAPFGTLVHHGPTVYIDLALSLEQMWSETRGNHRTTISKLSRNGFQARLDEWESYDDFISVYNMTMTRLGASEYYFFSPEYFVALRSLLGAHVHLCTVVSPEGEVAAAGLFTVTSGIVQYHLGGTADMYLRHAPFKLLFDFMRRWAKEGGNATLHLGGGVGSQEDSLFHFKAGFGSGRASFSTFRVIVDQQKYADLTEQVTQKHGRQNDPLFFPGYRR